MNVTGIVHVRGAVAGAEEYFIVLARALRRHGVTLHVVVIGANSGAVGYHAALTAEGVPATLVTQGLRKLMQTVWSLRADVLHWNFQSPFAFRAGLLLMLPWRAPSVVIDHLPMRYAGPRWELSRRLANRRIAALIM